MFKLTVRSVYILICVMFISASSALSASCCGCQSAEITVGWRRDDLNWRTRNVKSSEICGRANSQIHFKDINSYTLSGNLTWMGKYYYVRFSAEYGLTDKGRAREIFKLKSPLLYDTVTVATSDPIKRRSEVYDFDLALGYPFSCVCNRLLIIPLVGFSWHRQHLRVKQDLRSCSSYYYCDSSYCSPRCYDYDYDDSYDFYTFSRARSRYSSSSSSSHSYCCCPSSSSSRYCKSSSSSEFDVSSYNPFRYSPSSDPFASPSSSTIAESLGLITDHRTDNYRFTWYGFYLGLNLAYALDSSWTLYGEFEGHFLNNCHRKRKSWTGVYFVDDYHHKGWAYGYNSSVGFIYSLCDCWYATVAVDYKWWKGDSQKNHDQLRWQSVGVRTGVGYTF